MFRIIIGLLILIVNISGQTNESPSATCDCKTHNAKLKTMIQNGNIDALFLSDVNNGSYQNWSTSMLCPEDEAMPCKYSAYCASDRDPLTAWSEGVEGDGIGEIVLVQLDITSDIKIWGGYGKSPELFKANNRPKDIRIYYFGSLDYPESTQYGIGFKNISLLDETDYQLQDLNEYQSIPSLDESYQTENFLAGFVAIEILSVYKGDKYSDTCITEIHNQ